MKTGTKQPILYCRLTATAPKLKGAEKETNKSGISCFNKAISGYYRFIAISFSLRDSYSRNKVVDLCSALKTNSATEQIPLAVFMEKPHRNVITRLKNAGVDFVEFYSGLHKKIDDIEDLLKRKTVLADINEVLKNLCPFLRYIPIDESTDVPVCGAYKNRMVLGGTRLNEVCHSSAHKHCSFYFDQNQKGAS